MASGAVVVALVMALFCALAASTPAWAAGPTATEIAEELRESPVYVAGELRSQVPLERQRSMERQIEKSGLPIKVLLVPLDYEDRWGGEARQLTASVRERMEVPDDEHLIMITAWEEITTRIEAFEWPSPRYSARYAGYVVSSEERAHRAETDESSAPVELVERALPIVVAGDGEQRYREARKDDPYLSSPSEGEGTRFALVLLGGLVVCALAGSGALWVVRRRRSSRTFALPRHVFVAAREQSENDLRIRAQGEVLRLGEELRDLEASSDYDLEGLRRALDGYAAAGRVLDGAQRQADLAGVLALVTESRDAANRAKKPRNEAEGQSTAGSSGRGRVRGRGGWAGALGRSNRSGAKGTPKTGKAPEAPPLPLCFFQPLHGRAVKRTTWRPLGRTESLRVAVCQACDRAVRNRRAPEALTDVYEGRQVPYFDVPAEQSLWTATGFGSFGTESLTARVQRGDFSRAAAARAGSRAD